MQEYSLLDCWHLIWVFSISINIFHVVTKSYGIESQHKGNSHYTHNKKFPYNKPDGLEDIAQLFKVANSVDNMNEN